MKNELAAGDSEILITGGAGFIGANLAHQLASEGHSIVIYDNLARPGVERNLSWLQNTHASRIRFVFGDVRNAAMLAEVVRGVQCVFHLASQVGVTTSLTDPVLDFEVNARGTLNLLEVLRALETPPSLIFTSTSKVFGANGETPVSENGSLRFCSPHGCSKGAAEQYVLDYARNFGIRAVVFRLSSVYGPWQCGTEEQGWVAHFLIQTLLKRGITFYGDGNQVRDLLYIDDLVAALSTARQRIEGLAGQDFNIGGGPANATSLIELVDLIGAIHGSPLHVTYKAWRAADQHYYVSDAAKFTAATQWSPQIPLREGMIKFYQWLKQNPQYLSASQFSANAVFPVANQEVA